MKNKILVVGNKKGFIASHLVSYLKKKKTETILLDFKKFKLKKLKYLSKFSLIINTSTSQKFIEKSYQEKNDRDLAIAKKIVKIDHIKYVMLSTRKIYKIGVNIRENSKTKPKCLYSKNNLRAELKVRKILSDKRLLILRISNLIGFNSNNPKKVHYTFPSIFFKHIKKNQIFEPKSYYKDFLGVDKFCEIVLKLVGKSAYGVFNVSIGKKIYLKNIINWLNFYNPNKSKVKMIKNQNVECFTLSNNKLLNFIPIKISENDLRSECLNLSKKFFKKKII